MKSQTMENQKEKFEDFCRDKFANGKSTSKTITREKGQQITSYLKGDIPPPDPQFKHWVSKKGFKLLDYPILGLKNVLCLPTKNEDPNNPTVLSGWRRVAFVEEFFDILTEVHCKEKGHIGSKKTVREVRVCVCVCTCAHRV